MMMNFQVVIFLHSKRSSDVKSHFESNGGNHFVVGALVLKIFEFEVKKNVKLFETIFLLDP